MHRAARRNRARRIMSPKPLADFGLTDVRSPFEVVELCGACRFVCERQRRSARREDDSPSSRQKLLAIDMCV